jgi:hypothetical protein
MPTVFEIDRQAMARHDLLYRELLSLQGTMEGMKAREEKLVKDVAAAKGRKLLRPDNKDALEDLQRSAHERSVGAFERMLTGICDDVLPEYEGQLKVTLELTTERNLPALDIALDNRGKPEKITSGAVANVVSTGLRFIALARSGARPFLVLDEADCFIDGVAVQNYFNVVNQLCKDAGIQALVITHHDLSAFSEEFRIYRLTDVQSPDKYPARSMDMVSAGRMEPSEMNENPLTFIKAKNIENFPDAGIELSPTVTVITGANQKGKSGWARMLRAAFMAKDGEAVVRHDAPTGEVCVGFADGRVLEYQRHRKGKEIAEFAMHSPESWQERMAGVPLKEMRNGTSGARPLHHTVGAKLPEWVPGETGIYEIDGINVQMWGQFTPIFMLDAAASARASLLSIGRESGYLHAMSELYKEDIEKDNAIEREGEKEIAAIRATIKDMGILPELIARMDELKEEAQRINEEHKRLQVMSNWLQEIRNLREHIALLEQGIEAVSSLPDFPVIHPTSRMQDWLTQMQQARDQVDNEIIFPLPEMPVIHETAKAQYILDGLAEARAIASIDVPMPPDMPVIHPTREMSTFLEEMAQARRVASLEVPDVPAMPEIHPTREMSNFLEAMAQARKELNMPVDFLIPELPEIHPTQQASSFLKAIKDAAQELLAHQASLERAQAEMEQIEEGLRKATEVLGNECPVCNSIMTVDMLLQKDAHDHDHAHGHGHAHAHTASSKPALDSAGEALLERAKKAQTVSQEPEPEPEPVAASAPAARPTRLSFRRS